MSILPIGILVYTSNSAKFVISVEVPETVMVAPFTDMFAYEEDKTIHSKSDETPSAVNSN